MMNPMMAAKNQSLQNLMDTMDEDDSKKIPGITISISLPEGMEANVEGAGGDSQSNNDDLMPPEDPGNIDAQSGMQEGAEQSGVPGTESSPFEELMKKKLAEKRGMGNNGY